MVDNKEKGFDKKIKKLGEVLLHCVGMPGSVAFYKKYLLKNINRYFNFFIVGNLIE